MRGGSPPRSGDQGPGLSAPRVLCTSRVTSATTRSPNRCVKTSWVRTCVKGPCHPERVSRRLLAVLDAVFGDADYERALRNAASTKRSELLVALLESLVAHCHDWLQSEQLNRSGAGEPAPLAYFPMYPQLALGPDDMDFLKAKLLYLPGAVVCADPLAGVATWWLRAESLDPHMEKEISARTKDLVSGLRQVQEWRPLIESGDLILIPGIFPYYQCFGRAREALVARGITELPPTTVEFDDEGGAAIGGEWYYLMAETVASLPGYLNYDILVESAGAADAVVKGTQALAVAGVESATIGHLRGVTLPSITRISWADIARLRNQDDLFAEFRASFAEVARLAASPAVQPSGRELQAAADEILSPRVRAVTDESRRRSVLEQTIIGGLSLGGAAVEHHVTGQPPVGTLLALSAAELGWFLNLTLVGRAERAGRRELRRFYAQLIRSTRP